MNYREVNIEPKGYDFPSALKKAKSIKELTKVVIEQRRKEGLKFGSWMRIIWNGGLTIGQNVLRGKAPFPSVNLNIIVWIVLGVGAILLFTKIL